MSCRILVGDALDRLPELAAESVDAIVTSPPYADQRKSYEGYRWQDTFDYFAPFAVELLRVVSPTGSMMLNLGRYIRDGEEHPIAELARMAFQTAGWKWIDTIIWKKPNALIASSTQYLHSSHEYVWWLAPQIHCYRGYDTETRSPHAPDTLARWRQGFRVSNSKNDRYYKRGKRIVDPHPEGARPKTVFEAAIGTDRGLKHTAPMPTKLARHLVALTCPKGSLVLDPFAGSGTIGIVADQSNRNSVLIDKDPANAEPMRDRIRSAAPLLADVEIDWGSEARAAGD